ncbi:MAG TPA: Ig-like domain-containing protein [Candidatus Nanoarchaeia archaeon]|nr:Ig-like domain-containing protein [Candidatus Nanoarchaeia archaeon]
MNTAKYVGLCMLLLLTVSFVEGSSISSGIVHGISAYSELNIATPRFRLWNGSTNNFTAEQSAQSVGVDGSADISWIVLRPNHERDEIVMGTLDQDNDVNVQLMNSTQQWGNLLEVSTDVSNSAFRAFDIAIEDVSGDVLVVYENSSAATNNGVAYRIWNGTSFSSEYSITTLLANSPLRWIQLTPRAGSNDIMALFHNNAGDLYAALWNGTNFEVELNLTLSTSTASNTEEHFAFAWEQGNQGLVAYGAGNDFVYRTFSLTAPYWSNEATIALGNALHSVRLCSESSSDYIGIIMQDGGNDVNVRMWDGTQILASAPTEDAQTEPGGADTTNIDCVWLNSSTALFSFVDFNALEADYFNFTKTNSWSTSDLAATATTMSFASDDIASLRMKKHPVTDQILLVASDIAEDISVIRWNGIAFTGIGESPLELNTEVLNGDQEGALFAWDNFDPVPNVTNITPNGINFEINQVINLSVNVTDNLNVSAVIANITLPNGTVRQVTLVNVSAARYNATFDVTNLNGFYTLLIVANDSSLHQNFNNSQSVTFTVGDAIVPNVTNITTRGTSQFEQNAIVNITANVTDEIAVSVVTANITAPNGSIFQLTLRNDTNITKKFNASFYDTATIGTYTIRIFANDSSNNINNTQTSTFVVGDIVFPLVTNVLPASGSNFSDYDIVNISANVSDDRLVSVVQVNITLPNGTVRQYTLGNMSAQRYNITFDVTNLVGVYTVRIIANDTTNNVNSSETTSFTIGNAVAPLVVLNYPANNSNLSSTSIAFNFTATDDSHATLNCSITINSTTNTSNSAVVSGQQTLFNITGFVNAHYNWSISCNDSIPNVNQSSTFRFAVDTVAPQFNSLVTSPSAAADLDPNINVTVLANITDNTTTIHTVILQHKLSNESDDSYVNVTMTFWTGSQLFNASFNATVNATHTLRLFANDSAGNKDVSNTISFVVEYDRTWTRSPSAFTTVSASLNENVSIGNLTINNTGDIALYFNFTSDSNLTRTNETANFSLEPGAVKSLRVMDNSTAAGIKTIKLNISVNDTLANPRSEAATGTIVVAQGQPIFLSAFTTPSGDTLSATLGGNVEFIGQLKNIGEGNATNVSFQFLVPSGWTITFGSLAIAYAELNSGDTQEETLRMSIPSNADTGTFAVYINATGINASGANLTTNNLTFGDVVFVTLSAASSGLGSGSGGGGSSDSSSSPAASSSGGGGGGGGSVSFKAAGGVSTILQTSQNVRAVRGSGESVPVVVTNLYENALMKNIYVRAEGFLSDYVVISAPINHAKFLEKELKKGDVEHVSSFRAGQHTLTVDDVWDSGVRVTLASTPQTVLVPIDKIRYVDLTGDGYGDVALDVLVVNGRRALLRLYELRDLSRIQLAYGEQIDFSLDITAPEYLKQDDFNCTVRIDAELYPVNETSAGFTKRLISEVRTFLFSVGAVGAEDAELHLTEGQNAVQDMLNSGFSVGIAQNLLERAREALASGDYELSAATIQELITLKDAAFDAHQLLLGLQRDVARAQSQWLDVSQTTDALQLAVVSFERGDFTQAVERARTAQLQLVLETKGRVNVLWFIVTYWWALILGSIVSLLVALTLYSQLLMSIISQRLRNLDSEEKTIGKLLQETQQKYFDMKLLSSAQYKRSVAYYDDRLTKIRQIRAKLRHQRNALLTTQSKLSALLREKNDVKRLMADNQTDYLVRKKISRTNFVRTHDSYVSRLADIEHDEALLERHLLVEKRVHVWILQMAQMFLEYVHTLFVRFSRYIHGYRVSQKLAKPSYHLQVHSRHQQQSVWVPVSVPESTALDVYSEKMSVALPIKRIEYKPSFSHSVEAFDTELLRMASAAQQEERDSGTERTMLDVAHYKRKAEEKLRNFRQGDLR